MNKKQKSVVGCYVLGAGRSGTTMTEKLISSHPEIAGVMETEILKKYSTKFKYVDDMIKEIAVSDKETKIVTDYFKKNVKFREISKISPYIFMHHYCLAHASYQKKSFYVEKSPIHSLFLDEILREVPNSKIVIILRDPRSIYFSKNFANSANRGKLYHFPKFLRNPLNLSEIIFTYEYFDKAYRKFKNNKRVLFIKYEDLVQKPEKELRRIFKHVGVKYFPVDEKFAPNDLRLEGRARTKIKMNSSFKDSSNNKKNSILSSKSVDRWKQSLSKEKINHINQSFYDVAPTLCKVFYKDIKESQKGLKSKFTVSVSKLDKFIFYRKNIRSLSKVKLSKLK